MPTDPPTPQFDTDDLIATPSTAEEDAATLPLEPIAPNDTGESRVIEIQGLTIRGTLGEGGFGIVYLAEQTEPVHRLVALKIIKPGMDSRAIVARFEAERQALALMDHPGVARVFDGGTTTSGRPYFVMEYVAGEPISRFCDRQRMGIDDRLLLFAQVCEAIQHAHGKGVIHRDIKPSNVLVEFVDNQPTVKVIDFGVAKALNQRLSDKTVFTARGQLIGTPEYISPEQAEMTGVDVDTRSDVYSLGVILYELLTGTRPFSLRAHKKAGFSEIQRVIREVDPPRPSHRMTRLTTTKDDDTAITAARKRRIEPNQLVKRLRGDLDWVVMKCLEKNRDRRYDTAHEVAAEIRRHLNNEPVLAGPPSTRYRFHKFAQRKMGLLIASSVILLLLVGGIVTTSTLLFRAMAAEKKHDAAETRVRQQLAANAADLIEERSTQMQRMTAMIGLLEASLSAVDDWSATRDVPELNHLVTAATREALAEHPLIDNQRDKYEALARLTIGRHARVTGQTVVAMDLLGNAAAMFDESLGPSSPHTLRARHELALAIADSGDRERAAEMLQEVVRGWQDAETIDEGQLQQAQNDLNAITSSP